jgi:hypothetical protein
MGARRSDPEPGPPDGMESVSPPSRPVHTADAPNLVSPSLSCPDRAGTSHRVHEMPDSREWPARYGCGRRAEGVRPRSSRASLSGQGLTPSPGPVNGRSGSLARVNSYCREPTLNPKAPWRRRRLPGGLRTGRIRAVRRASDPFRPRELAVPKARGAIDPSRRGSAARRPSRRGSGSAARAEPRGPH